jgi:hypothetical protein
MASTFGITVFCAQSGPNFSTNFFKFNVAASRIAYTENKDNCPQIKSFKIKKANNIKSFQPENKVM